MASVWLILWPVWLKGTVTTGTTETDPAVRRAARMWLTRALSIDGSVRSGVTTLPLRLCITEATLWMQVLMTTSYTSEGVIVSCL